MIASVVIIMISAIRLQSSPLNNYGINILCRNIFSVNEKYFDNHSHLQYKIYPFLCQVKLAPLEYIYYNNCAFTA